MLKINMLFFRVNPFSSYFAILVAIASFALSIVVTNNVNLINRDGFLYIEVAELYLKLGYSAAFHRYSWPFFSILTAWLSKIIGGNVISAFYIHSAFSLGLLGFAYMKVAQSLFEQKEVVILSAIIFICFSTLNDYRVDIVRDQGFWAWSVLGFYFFLEAVKVQRILYLSYGILCILLATMYRVEGAITLLSLPLLYLLLSNYKELMCILKQKRLLLVVCIMLLIFIVGVIFVSGYGESSKLIATMSSTNISTYFELWHAACNHISMILPEYSKKYSALFLFAGVAGIFLAKIIPVMGVGYTLFCLLNMRVYIGWLKKNKPILVLMLVAAIPLVVFIYRYYFLSTRYIVLFSLLLLYPLAWCFYDVFFNRKSLLLKFVAGLLLFYSLVDGFYKSKPNDKLYYREASEWVESNLPVGAVIGTNSVRLSYMVNGLYFNNTKFNVNNFNENKVDYLLFKSKNGLPSFIKESQWCVLYKIKSDKNGYIFMFSRALDDVKCDL
ncbi:MAG: hypothetical protein KAG53_02910 [Endozoicomonadaceae bacterium]|nr:hypothetical protein [Endozoicomonadaceae bacterium]